MHCVASQPVRVSREFPRNSAKKPADGGLLGLGGESLCPEIDKISPRDAENLRTY